MDNDYVFTDFNITFGIVTIENPYVLYTYRLDGAHVRVAQRIWRKSPGKAWNYVKKVKISSTKTMKGEQPMTQAAEAVKRQKAVEERVEYMKVHGNFRLYRSAKGSFRVFMGPECDCDHRPINGLMFYKWVKAPNDGKKEFNRLIIHRVCYRCGVKGPIEVFDPVDYNKPIKGGKNPLWETYRLKVHYYKK